MTHLVIVVALSAQQIAYPVEQGDFRVGVMAAHHENDAVNQDQPVGQAGEGEGFPGEGQYRQADDRGQGFKKPGEPVVWVDRRPGQHRSIDSQPQDGFSFVGVGQFLHEKRSVHISGAFADDELHGKRLVAAQNGQIHAGAR